MQFKEKLAPISQGITRCNHSEKQTQTEETKKPNHNEQNKKKNQERPVSKHISGGKGELSPHPDVSSTQSHDVTHLKW